MKRNWARQDRSRAMDLTPGLASDASSYTVACEHSKELLEIRQAVLGLHPEL
jgi:hypothetical protein